MVLRPAASSDLAYCVNQSSVGTRLPIKSTVRSATGPIAIVPREPGQAFIGGDSEGTARFLDSQGRVSASVHIEYRVAAHSRGPIGLSCLVEKCYPCLHLPVGTGCMMHSNQTLCCRKSKVCPF